MIQSMFPDGSFVTNHVTWPNEAHLPRSFILYQKYFKEDSLNVVLIGKSSQNKFHYFVLILSLFFGLCRRGYQISVVKIESKAWHFNFS